LFHFHIADSNRWYPGAGHIDFKEVIDTLVKIGYKGFASAEILPLPDPETASEKTIKYMHKINCQD
jgi:sugar phosphate isomerase/epimerase